MAKSFKKTVAEIVERSPRLAKKAALVKKTDEICSAIKRHHGLITITAEDLGVSSTDLRFFISKSSRASAALKEARDKFLDVAEDRLYDLVEQGDLGAIKFVLMSIGKTRGYVLPTGTALENNQTNINVIEQVNIVPVPHGRFLSPADLGSVVDLPLLNTTRDDAA